MMKAAPPLSLKDRLLEFFSRHPRETFKMSEIVRRLTIPKERHPELRQTLRELERKNLIRREERKHYGHVKPPESHHVIGTLRILKQGGGIVQLHAPHEGEVRISQRLMKTGLNSDIVRVAIFAHPSSIHQKNMNRDKSLPEGEIVEVIKRSGEPIVGQLEKSKHFTFVAPDDSRIHRDVFIPAGKTHGARPGDKVVAVVEEWQSAHLNPEGAIIEVLGKKGEVRAEMLSVARMFNLPTHFPREVIEESQEIPGTIPEEEYRGRLDLRKELCFTIDPEDAKDFDDAVSLEILPHGDYKLGVHIADVSHYVKEGSALDREALKRGTSVYLADEVIPMLPEKLSNEVCSLRPYEDRLTFSAMMILDDKGVLKDYTLEKSIINSRRRFTYEEVQKILDTGRGDHAQSLRQMHDLAQILLKKRMKEGSIDFETAEVKFRFDDEGKPVEIVKKKRLDAHRLIEDFMLLANKTVAGHIVHAKNEKGSAEAHLRPFVYRVHDSPDAEKIQELAAFVGQFGYALNASGGITSTALQKLLNDIRGKEEEAVINEVAIRSMAKAVYSPKNIGHFGLGFKHYTHFTSPIRRYPDLVVHRLLMEYQPLPVRQAGDSGLPERPVRASRPGERSREAGLAGKHGMTVKRRQELLKRLPEISSQASLMELRAMEAERESVKVMQVEYMKRHLGDEFRAVVSGVAHFGLFVEIADLLVEGLIRVRDLEDDYYIYDEKNYALVGRRTKKRYRLGDKVTVQVVRVDPEEREIDFVLVD